MSQRPQRPGRGKGPMIRPRPSDDEAGPSEHRECRVRGRYVTASARRVRYQDEQAPGPAEPVDMPMYGHEEYTPVHPPFPHEFQQGYTPEQSFPYELHEEFGADDDIAGGVEADEDPWILRGPAPGGPYLVELIPSFGGHVALDIWLGQEERGVLTGHSRYAILRRWQGPTDEDSLALIGGSRLEHLRDCMFQRHNMALICAFVERWQPDTNSFHMPFGEMTITLHDVHYILGVPVQGRPVSTTVNRDIMVVVSSEILRVDVGEMERMWVDVGPTWTFIQDRCDDDSNASSICRARGYLMYLLGATLFVDKSKSRVKPWFAPLLRDVEQIGNYAWGAGALAYMYRQLGIASRADCRQIAGCLTLLEAWIYEYFPRLRPAQAREYEVGQPRCRRWRPASRPDNSPEKLVQYRMMLDELTEHEVTWLPYGRDVDEEVPTTLFHGTLSCVDIREPYMPNRVLRQFGFIQIIPAAPYEPSEPAKRSRGTRDYRVTYANNDRAWNTPGAHQFIREYYGVPAIPPTECVRGYREWYEARTHRRIMNPANVPGGAADVGRDEDEPTEPEMRRAVYEVTRTMWPVDPSRHPDTSYEELQRAARDCNLLLEPFARYLRLVDDAEPDERRDRGRAPGGEGTSQRRPRRGRR